MRDKSQNSQLLQTVVSAPLGDEGATGAPRGFVGFPEEVTSKSQPKRKFNFFFPPGRKKNMYKGPEVRKKQFLKLNLLVWLLGGV